jgi:RNA polymerase sigma-70 factor (ECF subfamily)
VQTANKQREPAEASGPATSHVHDQLGLRQRKYYPEVAAIEAGSRVGAVLVRLSAALDAAEADRHVPGALQDDLITMVARLRRDAYASHATSELFVLHLTAGAEARPARNAVRAQEVHP